MSNDTAAFIQYENWLLSRITSPQTKIGKNLILAQQTSRQIQFNSSVPNDINRVNDVLAERYHYSDTTLAEMFEVVDYPVTLFEVLVVMAVRMAEQTYNYEEERTPEMFELLLWNLGLIDVVSREEMMARFHTVNDRTYAYDGYGGLFPLKNAIKDQRKVELWYQMNAWLSENESLISG